MRRVAALLLAVALTTACGAATSGVPARAHSTDTLPPSAERAYRALATRFDRQAAMDVVTFMDQFWRLAGNPGFNASLDHIRNRLASAGFGGDKSIGTLRVDEFAASGRGWDYRIGTLTCDVGTEPALLSRERDRVSLAINSFPTPRGGVRAPLVDVGAGDTEADFAGKQVRGAVVLGDAGLGRLWQEAVKKRGAIGVVSTEIAPYIRPSDPAAMSEAQKDVLHSSQDRPDETSAAEMENVGVAAATSAWFLASADAADAAAVVDLLASSAARRLALEREQGGKIVAAAATRADAEAVEAKVIAAWVKWYGEALDSVLRLPAGGPHEALRARVAEAKGRLR